MPLSVHIVLSNACASVRYERHWGAMEPNGGGTLGRRTALVTPSDKLTRTTKGWQDSSRCARTHWSGARVVGLCVQCPKFGQFAELFESLGLHVCSCLIFGCPKTKAACAMKKEKNQVSCHRGCLHEDLAFFLWNNHAHSVKNIFSVFSPQLPEDLSAVFICRVFGIIFRCVNTKFFVAKLQTTRFSFCGTGQVGFLSTHWSDVVLLHEFQLEFKLVPAVCNRQTLLGEERLFNKFLCWIVDSQYELALLCVCKILLGNTTCPHYGDSVVVMMKILLCDIRNITNKLAALMTPAVFLRLFPEMGIMLRAYQSLLHSSASNVRARLTTWCRKENTQRVFRHIWREVYGTCFVPQVCRKRQREKANKITPRDSLSWLTDLCSRVPQRICGSRFAQW